MFELSDFCTLFYGSAFMLERTRKHDLEGNGLPNRA